MKVPSIPGTSALLSLALLTLACSSKVTAKNVTLEECKDLFPDYAPQSEAERDYDDDGDYDDDDDAIKDRCCELLDEAES
jgi:hypothetical protein